MCRRLRYVADGVELILKLAVAREGAVDVVSVLGQGDNLGNDGLFLAQVFGSFGLYLSCIFGLFLTDTVQDVLKFGIFGLRSHCLVLRRFFRSCFSRPAECVELLAQVTDVVGRNLRGVLRKNGSRLVEQSLAGKSLEAFGHFHFSCLFRVSVVNSFKFRSLIFFGARCGGRRL